MRRRVATEERICPRSSALRNPTDTRVARATCARESPRRVRNRRTSASVYIRYLLFVRCGATSPTISHARNAEDEIPTRRATSLMRSRRLCEALSCNRVRDWLDEFFPLDTGDGFL